MPKTIKNEDTGEDEVLYSAEEIEAQKTEAIETYKKENPGNAEEVGKLQKELDDAKEALKKAGDKDQNFGQLRDKVDKLEKEMDERVKRGVEQTVTKQTSDNAIKALAGSDTELEKKIRFHFDNSLKGVVPSTPEEANKKAQDAYLLATGQKPDIQPGAGNAFGSSGGGGFRQPQQKKSDIKPEVAALGKNKLGLTDEDIKKYDRQDFSHTE